MLETGLARNLRLHYPKSIAYGAVLTLLLANVINLAADIAAMGDALHLLIGGPTLLYSVIFGAVCLVDVVFISYARFAEILKWGTLVLLVYVATAFVVHIPLHPVIVGSLIPALRLNGGYLALTAVLGTTITSYLFF